jgi:hypothetical protein
MGTIDTRIRTALVSVNPTTAHPAWHGAPTALGVLRGVNSSMAVWRPYPGGNNIREITLHIAFWENSVANRLSGENHLVGFKQRKTSWVIRQDTIDEQQWKSEIGILKTAHQRLVDALTRFDPALLDQPVGKKTVRPVVEFIHGVAEHSLHHATQIEMIKTLLRARGLAESDPD